MELDQIEDMIPGAHTYLYIHNFITHHARLHGCNSAVGPV